MRSDAEIVAWVAPLFDPAVDEELKHDRMDSIVGAMSCGLGGREALEAAMGAIKLEIDGPPQIWRTGVQRIADERDKQIGADSRSLEWDRQVNAYGELLDAAACYIDADIPGTNRRWNGDVEEDCPLRWPWALDYWRPTSLLRNLEKAGALIAAEIDRLQGDTIAEQDELTPRERADLPKDREI